MPENLKQIIGNEETFLNFFTKIEVSLLHIRHILKGKWREKRLAIDEPKTDQCDVYVGFETKNTSEEYYNKHIKRKNEARIEKISEDIE